MSRQNPGSIRWDSVLYIDMEEPKDEGSSSEEERSWRRPPHQRRTFYNGRETERPYQRRGGRRGRRRAGSQYRYVNPRMASSNSVAASDSERPQYGLEFFPNSVNVDRSPEEGASNDVIRDFMRAKENFFSMKNSISPADIVMDYRQQIQEMSEQCTAKNFQKVEKITPLIGGEEAYASIFKLHYKNLILQQKQFDAFISGQKNECSIIHENDIDDIIRRADKIKKSVQIECKLFERTLPAYAYKEDVLRELEKNEVVLVASDCSYFFDTVLPIVLANEALDYSVVSCESSALLRAWVKRDVESLLAPVDGTVNMKSMVETDLLNYLNEGVSSKKHCFVFSLQQKRSVASDLLLSVFRDLLTKQKQHRLILLLSIFDDVQKFANYFVGVRVFTLSVPKLLLPVQTVWKGGASGNYKEDAASTALALHLLNDPGDVFVFLPSLAEAKTTLAMLVAQAREVGRDDLECALLHEGSAPEQRRTTTTTRKFFFIPGSAAVRPMPSVRYLIDCGLVRDSRFDEAKNLDVLTTSFNSRAQARLRKSLVGVFVSGVCYRTYNKENFCSDMRSYEPPDLLTLDPFNTLLTLFRHRPENALSVAFVEPLGDAVKYNTVKLLRIFGAIKQDRLSELGKKMVRLPLPARYSKLVLQSLQWGFAYEAVILVAFLLSDANVFRHFKNEDAQIKVDAAKLELAQCESDALTFLHIYKCWTENKNTKTWCDQYHIEYDTLIEVKTKVVEICNIVRECLNEHIVQQFSEETNASSHISEMLFRCFADHLCVYSGHYRCGYRILSSRQPAFLHPSTVLCTPPPLLVFSRVVRSSRNFLWGATAVQPDWVRTALADKTLDYDYSDVFERALASRTLEPVGERLIKQGLLGRKGKKLQEIEASIQRALKSEWIVVDPSPERGCVHVYALPEVLDAAVERVEDVLKSDLEDVIRAEQVHVLELKKGDVTVPVEVRCVRGAHITSAKIKDVAPPRSKSATEKSVRDGPSSVQYSINLTWVRRPCNGICFVNFTPDGFLRARKLACANVRLLESEVYVEVSRREEHQLVLSDVPREARTGDIERALARHLPGVAPTRVEPKFVAPFETTARDIEEIKMAIQENCEEFTHLVDFDVVVPKPKNSASIMIAYINVSGSEDLTAAAADLSNTMLQNFKVHAIPVYRSVLKCSFKIYSMLQTRIENQVKKLKGELSKVFPDRDLFRFEAEHIHHKDLVLIKLLSNDIQIMKRLQRALHELLEGEILSKELVKDVHKLFCHGGHLWLRTLEKAQKVYVVEDYHSKVIRVYGSQQSCFHVKERILEFLEDTENEAVETIVLSSGDNSRKLLKALIREYGVNLKPLVERCSLRSAVLDIQLGRLYLHGSRESIDQAKDIVNMHSSGCEAELCVLSSDETCPVCSCVASNLSVRLQHCGHLYCSECIRGLLEQEHFPLQCCAEGCSEDIVLDDIVRILDEDDAKLQKLLRASLHSFLEKNRAEIFYCPAPDCEMFAYKEEVPHKWLCPLCQNEICTKCNVMYHVGFTCELYQGSKEDPNYSYKVWKSGRSECRECPKCGTAIERTGGCDHMVCGTCQAHFCWVCTREFPTDLAVYNHIPFCDKHQKW